MKLFNFKDLTHKTDFGTSRGRTVFHLLRKPLGGGGGGGAISQGSWNISAL